MLAEGATRDTFGEHFRVMELHLIQGACQAQPGEREQNGAGEGAGVVVWVKDPRLPLLARGAIAHRLWTAWWGGMESSGGSLGEGGSCVRIKVCGGGRTEGCRGMKASCRHSGRSLARLRSLSGEPACGLQRGREGSPVLHLLA